jgi:hypothetical protein
MWVLNIQDDIIFLSFSCIGQHRKYQVLFFKSPPLFQALSNVYCSTTMSGLKWTNSNGIIESFCLSRQHSSLDYGVRIFWWVVEFGLQVLYLDFFFCFYSLKRMACNYIFFVHLVQFLNEYNMGFIEWMW